MKPMVRWEDIVEHAFKGPRFKDGPLDVEAMSELPAYRALVVRVAEELWRRRNSERMRLPRNFGDRFQLRCARIEKGSSVAVLERNRESEEQMELGFTSQGDVFDEAIALISDAIDATNLGVQLPSGFSKQVLPMFRNWGRSLRDNETIEIRSRRNPVCRSEYSSTTRSNLLSLVEVDYEDRTETTGHVLATSIRHGRFELYPDPTASYGIDVPLSQEHERVVLDALVAYSNAKVTVKGRAAFSAEGHVVRFVEVETVETLQTNAPDNTGLWQRIAALSATVSANTWETLPRDASQRIDAYLP
jgi:hypothetical protein